MILGKLADILGMIKFSHTLFALPFALLGAALAARTSTGWTLRPLDWLAILLCMVTARSAAMAFNRLVDRKIDAQNPRTAMRHLPAGKLPVSSVAWFHGRGLTPCSSHRRYCSCRAIPGRRFFRCRYCSGFWATR